MSVPRDPAGKYRTVNCSDSTFQRLQRARRELSFDLDVDLTMDQVLCRGLEALAEAGDITPDDVPAVTA